MNYFSSSRSVSLTLFILYVGWFSSLLWAAEETWDDRFVAPVLFGSINAIDRSDSGEVAVGGLFSGNAPGDPGRLNANYVAAWNGRRWTRLGEGSSNGTGGAVFALKWVGDDLYVGGEFFNAGGNPASRIARWNGTQWQSLTGVFGEGLSGNPYAMDSANGVLYVGGDFNFAGGVPANGIVTWDGDRWASMGSGFSGGPNPIVSAIAVAPDGTVYAGGNFTHAEGQPAAGIAKWNGATWSAMGAGLTGPSSLVRAIAIGPEGQVVAGGNFTTAGGQPAENLAIWDGDSWQELVGGVQNGEVYALDFEGDTLWVGGTFSSANNFIVSGIGTLENGIWRMPAIDGVHKGEVTGISVEPDGVYICGSFTRAGDLAGVLGMARWDGTEFQPLHRGFPDDDNLPTAISVAGTNVMVGGQFTTVGGFPAQRVTQWDGEEWRILGTPLQNGVGGIQYVYDVAAEPDGGVFIGGDFSLVAGLTSRNFAHWNGTQWQIFQEGFQGGNNTSVWALERTPEGLLFAGGIFDSVEQIPAKSIARWDGFNWTALGNGLTWTADPSRARVASLAWSGDRLYAGGQFDQTGTLELSRVAFWDGSSWHDMDGGVRFEGFLSSVQTIAVDGFDVYVGGSFDMAGSVPAARVARWRSGEGWSPLGDGFDSGVDALLVHGGRLFAAGNFEHSGSTPLPGLAEWNGSEWQEVNGGLKGNYPYAIGLAAGGTNLYVSGRFESVGSTVSSHFAILHLTNAPPAVDWVRPMNDAIVPNDSEMVLEVFPEDADGAIASVTFYQEGSPEPLATVTTAPWETSWSSSAAGTYRFTARVEDDDGASTHALVRRVTVLPPGSNAPPLVSIASPENGSTFKATPDRLLVADASDPDGSVIQVDFYSSNAPLGTVNSAPWELIWPDLQAGTYQLSAVAWDNSGARSTSAVVNVTVLPPNSAPFLQFSQPDDDAVFEAPEEVRLRVNSSDSDGGLVSVEFFINDELLVEFTDDLGRYGFSHDWSPVPTGDYEWQVVCTDTDGATSEGTRSFLVVPFNEPPQISWLGPPDGTTTSLPGNIPLPVEASDPDGNIAQVEWMDNNALLGVKTNSPWIFNLRNLAATTYYLKARAVDNQGKSVTTPITTLIVTNNPALQPKYRLVDLSIPGGETGYGYDVNNEGQVALTTENGDRDLRGFRYQLGTYIDIGNTVTPQIPTALFCNSINNEGVVAGYGHINGRETAFTWSNNSLVQLGTLGNPSLSGMFSRARDINDLGMIVGGSRNEAQVNRAFLFANGTMTDLGGLDETLNASEAFAINDHGDVVGWVQGVGIAQAFLYTQDDGMQGLGYFGGNGNNSSANDINNLRQVVGRFSHNNASRAFLWANGIEVQLGTLGGNGSIAMGINNAGQVVGTAENPNSRDHAFLWQGCAMFDLNDCITNTNWELRTANAINDNGWIVGTGYKDFDNDDRPFLLIPDEESGYTGTYSPIRFVNGRFEMCIPVPAGTTYRLDATIDLENWIPIATNYVPEGVLDFYDPDVEAYPNRFYRAVVLP